MRILVVDDEGIVLVSCQRILEPEGHEVILAKSAENVLNLLENSKFSVLIIDMKMPVHDGIYLMKAVRERWSDLPIILMSGYPTDETIALAMDTGADAFVPKPFTPDELIEAIRRVVQ